LEERWEKITGVEVKVCLVLLLKNGMKKRRREEEMSATESGME